MFFVEFTLCLAYDKKDLYLIGVRIIRRKTEMKKAFIAIMVILTVFSASVFAENGFKDFTGLSVGWGFSKVKFTTKDGLEVTESSNPLVISVSEYTFKDDSIVGLYADVGVTIPLNFKRNDVKSDDWLAGVFLGIGPAFKFDAGRDISLLIGAGFHFYTETTDYKYNGPYARYKIEYNYFGAGADVQASYKLGRSFAITAGASVSYYFANYSRYIVDTWWSWEKTYDVSHKSYSEFRVLPKIAGYYVY